MNSTTGPEAGSSPDSGHRSAGYLVARTLATGLFSGYTPVAPGTAGSLVGLLLYLIPGMEDVFFFFPLILVVFFAGRFAADKVAQVEGPRLTKAAAFFKSRLHSGAVESDPSIVVIDEIVGMWLALLFLPKTLAMTFLAFVLFRIFDIVKPFPARKFEQLPHGWGIMLDDVVAGVYANIVCQVGVTLFSAIV